MRLTWKMAIKMKCFFDFLFYAYMILCDIVAVLFGLGLFALVVFFIFFFGFCTSHNFGSCSFFFLLCYGLVPVW